MSRKDKSPTQNTPPQANDLEQLRDILFGNQAQAINQQLTDLETRLETTRAEWKKNLNAQISKTAQTAAANLSRAEKEFAQKLAAAQQQQEEADAAQTAQLQAAKEELEAKLEQQIDDLKQQLRDFQTETRRQHDALRLEILALGAMLDNQKTGRLELGQLLIQLGEQLQNNVRQTAETETVAS